MSVISDTYRRLSSKLMRYCVAALSISLFINTASPAASENKIMTFASYSAEYKNPPRAYIALLHHVMTEKGWKVEYLIYPPKRMPLALAQGKVDTMITSKLRRDIIQEKKPDNFIQSRYPLTTYTVFIYYKRSDQWKPSWPPEQSTLRDAKGVSTSYSYLKSRGLKIERIDNVASGVKMVNAGRVDYIIDGLRAEDPTRELIKSENEGYILEKYIDSPLFFLFRDTERGNKLRDIWDKGIEALLLEGDKYREIFSHQINNKNGLDILDSTIEYLRGHYPGLESIE